MVNIQRAGQMKRQTKLLLAGSSFGVGVASAIGWLTGSAQLGLHAAFWLSLVFVLWLESRIAE
jgi:hypothetical protein